MQQEFPGRIFQDENFVVAGFNGKKLESLIGVEDPEKSERSPILIYIKAEGNDWQQFFLDAGLGFWENWGTIEIEDDGYAYPDYSKEFEVENQVIKSIYCKNSQITIEFENGEKLILRSVNPEEFDSECEIIKES